MCVFALLAILSIDKHSLTPNLIPGLVQYYAHILTMPDKPFSVLLHIATSLETSLFIAIFNTMYSGVFFPVPLPFFIAFIWKLRVKYHSYSFEYVLCVYVPVCITSYNFNFTFPNQRKTNASSKCVLFLSHFPSNRFTFLFSLSISPFFHSAPFFRCVSENGVREPLSYYLIELCWYMEYHCDDGALLYKYASNSNCMDK